MSLAAVLEAVQPRAPETKDEELYGSVFGPRRGGDQEGTKRIH
jgi:hypothetical protein